MRLIVLALAACLGASLTAIADAHPVESRTYPCYGSTEDWEAWIETGATEPELVVSGTVTTPTGGNWSILALGATPWDDPPRQFIDLQIRSTGGDIVTLAVVTERVTGRFRLPPHFVGPEKGGTIIVKCNGQEVGKVLARERPVVVRPEK